MWPLRAVIVTAALAVMLLVSQLQGIYLLGSSNTSQHSGTSQKVLNIPTLQLHHFVGGEKPPVAVIGQLDLGSADIPPSMKPVGAAKSVKKAKAPFSIWLSESCEPAEPLKAEGSVHVQFYHEGRVAHFLRSGPNRTNDLAAPVADVVVLRHTDAAPLTIRAAGATTSIRPQGSESALQSTVCHKTVSSIPRLQYSTLELVPSIKEWNFDIQFGVGMHDKEVPNANMRPDEASSRVVVTFDEPVSFYGAALRGSGLKLSIPMTFTLKNSDVNHYTLDERQALYGSVPFVYVVRDGASEHTESQEVKREGCVGLLWMNGAETTIETKSVWRQTKISFASPANGGNIYVLRGPTPSDVLQQYYLVTGRPSLPPLFSLGYHQCRWSYRDEQDVLDVSHEFDARNIPCDSIWLDIDHTNDKRYFTWHPVNFPRPKELQDQLWKSQRRLVTISDPHIKVDDEYSVYSEAHKSGYFVKSSDSQGDFTGHCWPGKSSWVDFLNPEARKWYASLFWYDRYVGSTSHLYTWIDMNEPSVFSGPQLTLPYDTLHYGGTRHGSAHNLYGFFHAMAAFQGHEARSQHRDRPFVLTRAFFAGTQRYAAVWTGDNQAKWPHLKGSVDMILQLSICGIPLVGADVGGFFDDPDPRLVARWYEVGAAIYPFFRSHSHEQTHRREPWMFSPEINLRVAAAIRLRYALLPYYYTTMWEVAVEGTLESVVRPLFFEYPNDRNCYDEKSTVLLGKHMLVRPLVSEEERFVDVELYYPKGRSPVVLYDYWSGAVVAPPSKPLPGQPDGSRKVVFHYPDHVVAAVPLFVIGGGVVPLSESRGRSSEEFIASGEVRLVVALSEENHAEGKLYLDDGTTTLHLTDRRFCVISFEFLFHDLNIVLPLPVLKATYRRGSMCAAAFNHQKVVSISIFNGTVPSFSRVVIPEQFADMNRPPRVQPTRDIWTVLDLNLPLAPANVDQRQSGDGLLWEVQFAS